MIFLETNTSTAIAGLTVLVLFLYFIARKNGRAEKKPIPIAKGGWPLIGHLHLFSGNQLPHVALAAMADECGPIFGVQLGMNPALVINTREMAEESLGISDAAVSSRPKFTAAKHLTYNYAMFPFCPYGSYWREMRKITTSELLSTCRLEQFKKVRRSEVEASLKELHKLWSEEKDASGHVLVDMKEWFWNLTLNVMVRMIAGKRYSGGDDGGHEGAEARKWRKTMTEFFQMLGLSVVSDAFPFLEWLDIGGHVKAMKRTAKEMDCILGEWLEEHRQRKANSGNMMASDDQQDFMDVMLSVLDGKEKLGEYDVATVNKATCLTMIAGGSDTTSDILTWALSLILNHPHTLRQAQEEIKTHIRDKESVNESDISELVYLQAIIKETFRSYPPATLFPRESIEDCIIGGYHVPKGTRVIVNVWKIHNDSRVWSDPFEFKPERFLTTHKNVDVRGKNFELIPFGSGRRGCPGIVLGLQILHLTLANLLHEFEISTPSNAPIDMTERFGLTNMKATPLEVLIKPRRLSPEFYK